MAHNEIRVNKSREDEAIDTLVKSLDDLGGCKFLFPPDALQKRLRELIVAELNDAEETFKNQEQYVGITFSEIAANRASYEAHLTECVSSYFHEHAHEKFQVALAELIQESLAFAHPIYRAKCGASKEEINEGSPKLADLQQNVLRRSILRLNNLPYRRHAENDIDVSNEALSPLNRASAEIFNHLAFWTYDHVRVAHLFKDTILPSVKDHDRPNEEAEFYAKEAAEIVWDNIDGAMQAMVNILTVFAYELAKASAMQRHRHLVPRSEAKKYNFSPSDLEHRANYFLRSWFNILTVKLEKTAGRKPTEPKESESEAFKDRVIEKMLEILDESEAITQYRVAGKLNIGNPRNRKDRTLYNKLCQLRLDWGNLKTEAKRVHWERQSAQ